MPITIITGSKRLVVQGGKRMAISAAISGGGGGGGGSAYGLLGDGTRDKLLWPFASNSIWNTPIGASASLVAAPVTFGYHDGNQTRLLLEDEFLFMNPSESATCTVKYSPAEWTGADRCPPSGSAGGFPLVVRMPSSLTIPSNGENNCAAWIDPDGQTIYQVEPLARCSAGGDGTAFVRFSDEDIYLDGENGAHGGSNLSALGGTIRYGELTDAVTNGRTYLRHVLKVNLQATYYYYWGGGGGNQYRWPATTADGYANGTTYGGSNSNVKPGALLTLHSSFNVAALRTDTGKILAATFKRFGAYCVDDTYQNGMAIAIENGPAGSVASEFLGHEGVTWRQTPSNYASAVDWYKDVADIAAGFYVVSNNGSGAIGGGGSPAYSTPNAPVIGN